VFYLRFLYLYTYAYVQHGFDITWCSCRLTITRRMPIVKWDLLTLPHNLHSPPVSFVLRSSCCSIVSVLCSIS